MKTLLKALFFSLFVALLLGACSFDASEAVQEPTAEPAEPVGTLEQAQTPPCFITAHTNHTQPGFNGTRTFSVKAMNLGDVTCPYKLSVEIYKNGAYYGAAPLQSNNAGLAPYNFATGTPTKTHLPSFAVTLPCAYRIWWKYKPYISGNEVWIENAGGPFWC